MSGFSGEELATLEDVAPESNSVHVLTQRNTVKLLFISHEFFRGPFERNVIGSIRSGFSHGKCALVM